MPKKAAKSQKKPPKKEEVVEAVAEAEPEIEKEPTPTPEPTAEEKQQQIDALLEEPTSFEHIVLDHETEAPSQAMKRYTERRKQQYLDAHSHFELRRKAIVADCNGAVASLANTVRKELTVSDTKLKAMRDAFVDEKALQRIGDEEAMNAQWTAMSTEFSRRQSIFDTFSASAKGIEEQRKSQIAQEIDALIAACNSTGLITPKRVDASVQCKHEQTEQKIAAKLKCYAQFTVRLEDSDAELKAKCEDEFKDGKLRWSQLKEPKQPKEEEKEEAVSKEAVAS